MNGDHFIQFYPFLVPRVQYKLTGDVRRTPDTFLQCFLENDEGERIQLDFAQDSPYRLEPLGEAASPGNTG